MPLLWRKRLFFICLPVLISLAVWNTHLKTDISAFFVAGDNAEAVLLASEMQSGHLSRRYILSIGYAAESNGELEAFSTELMQALSNIEGIASVWQPGKQQVVTEAIKQLYLLHGSRMFSLSPDEILTNWMTDQALATRAAQLKQALLSPQGALVKKVAQHDPLLLSLSGFKSLAQQANTLTVNENYRILILETEASGLEASVQKGIQTKIHTVFNRHNQSKQAQYALEMTGVPLFASTIQASVSADITYISIASSLLLTLLFLSVFRSVKVFLWVSLILAAVIASAVWMTSLVFGYVHGLTLAVGTTLVGICIDYPIHTLVHAAEEPSSSSRLRVVETLWPSLILGGLTTVIGYTALGLSGYPGFQQIAVYAGSGIFVALALTRYVLPALMHNQVSPIYAGFSVNGWLHGCQKYRRSLLGLLAVIVIAAIASLPRLQWINDLGDLTPELNQLKAQDQRIRARMVSVEPGRFVLITGENVEAALQKSEQVYHILETLKQRGEVDNYFGLYPWILSQQLQNQNQQALQTALTDRVIKQWHTALATQGLSVERLGQLDYSQQQPLQLKQVLESPVKQLISGQVIVKDDQVLLMVWLAMHQPEAVIAALEGMNNVTYFSQRDMLNKMAAQYRQQAVKMLALGLSLIIVLLMGRYKSLLRAIQTLLPAIISALVVLTGWAWSGHALSFLHLVGFLLAVAICVDYGIFYSENRAGNSALTYRAMAVSMLTSAAAFACLGAAESGALQTLGATVALGVVLGFLLCPLLILPSVRD